MEAGVIPAQIYALQFSQEAPTIVSVIKSINTFITDRVDFQTALGQVPGAVKTLVGLYRDCRRKCIIMMLTQGIIIATTNHRSNQTLFVDAGIGVYLKVLVRVKRSDVMLTALDLIERLVEYNHHTQQVFIKLGVYEPIVAYLKTCRILGLQERFAGCLWAMAGEDIIDRPLMAERMCIRMLINFTSSISLKLQFLGIDALGVLALNPLGLHDAFNEGECIQEILVLLKNARWNEQLVLNSLQTLAYMCVMSGVIPHRVNQNSVCKYRGMRLVLHFHCNANNELLKAQAAWTLSSVVLCKYVVRVGDRTDKRTDGRQDERTKGQTDGRTD